MVYKPVGEWWEKGRKKAVAVLNNVWTMTFPLTCVFCGADGAGRMDLCAGCRRDLPLVDVGCYCCGLPLTGTWETGSEPANRLPLCGRCIRRPNNFDRTCCPYVYKQPIDWLIQQLKFHARLSHIKVLGGLLQEYLVRADARLPELIVPVPMHPGRQRQRGFNQALEIARPLARHFNIPLAADLCERHLDTAPQRELPAKRRAANVRNAFRLRRPLNAGHVAIIDDVMTTGATANELAKLLKRHGAEHVQVWVLARTVVE